MNFFLFFPLHYSWILSIHSLNSAAVQSLLQYTSGVRYLIRISLSPLKGTLLHEVRLWSPLLDAPKYSPAVLYTFLMFLSSCPTLTWEQNTLVRCKELHPHLELHPYLKYPFQKIWNYSVLLVCFLTELSYFKLLKCVLSIWNTVYFCSFLHFPDLYHADSSIFPQM